MLRGRRFFGFIAISEDGAIAGSGGIWLREVHPTPHRSGLQEPYLLSMYTEPGCRGRGVASGIVREAMKWCKEAGYETARLHASKMGRSVYTKLGWERTWEMRTRL